jgi:hypothetical protein
MISWIFILSAIAVVFYVLIPVLYARVHQKRTETILDRLRSSSCFSATVAGVFEDTLSVQPDRTLSDSPDEELMALNVKKTRFFALHLDDRIEQLRWGDLIACKTGGTLMIYLPGTEKAPAYCVFHEERNRKAYEARLNRAKPAAGNTVKPFSIAAGVLFEFIIFLHALHSAEMTPVALLALIAMFGKALPYCPPGLLFTWFGHRMTAETGTKDKKSRQRGTVGILIYTAGILLNIAALILIISSSGLGGNSL